MMPQTQPRVLMFGWEFPPFNSGGLGTACHGLTKGLSKHNVSISFVLPRKIGAHSQHVKLIYADNKKITYHLWNSLLKGYITSQAYREAYKNTQDEKYGRDLMEEVERYSYAAAEIAKKEPHNIVHAHDWLSFPAGMRAKRVAHKPLVAHVHATEFDRSNGNVHGRIYQIEKEGMEQADRVVAVSQYTKNLIHAKYHIPQSKVHVIHNGIDLGDYANMDNRIFHLKQFFPKIVLFVGRLTLQKGPDYFIRAAEKVLSYDNEVTFIVSGSGDMEHQILTQAIHAGISHKIFFTGFLRGEDLNAVFRAADLFVMPSVSEPFGIAALEAIANNTPILVSKQSGVSEVLTHALKVNFWDTNEMANQILSLLRYGAMKECLRENGRKEVEKYTWDRSAHQCSHLYQQLLH